MSVIAWIIMGGVIGWVASLIMHTNKQQGLIANIIIGIIGSLLGGFIARLFGGAGITGINVYSFVIGVVGAIILIAFVRLIFRGGHAHAH
ncbi:MAG TPA: GlsB/YeaQ/YmgE family stress response membrane protein [Candidatus Saccharimonadales bacterium]|jgi:uncharacterized membrane protein YeaQ/YmgE (transglycosylase-associated protein family)|nr:GlsB/YeaQ/YmgE family stress response membrane protein [Candidatus Saccharimonadales bacterium]